MTARSVIAPAGSGERLGARGPKAMQQFSNRDVHAVRSECCSDRRDRVRPAGMAAGASRRLAHPAADRFATVALLSLAVLGSGVALSGSA